MTFRHVENPYKTNEKRGFSKAKNVLRKPLWILSKMKTFEPKSQYGIENNQKSITFIDKFDMTFRHVEKPYKTNENEVSQKPKTRCENPYNICVKLMIFESKSQKGLKMIKKHYVYR